MVALAAADTQVGDDAASPAERPAFGAHVKAFLLDVTPVTVAQFAAFVRGDPRAFERRYAANLWQGAEKRPDKLKELEAAYARWEKDMVDPKRPSRPQVNYDVCGAPFEVPF